MHNLFDLCASYETKLDFTKHQHEKVSALVRMAILLLDEVSMLDCDIYEAITKLLGLADHSRRGHVDDADEYGSVHLVLFGALDLVARRMPHLHFIASTRSPKAPGAIGHVEGNISRLETVTTSDE